MRLSLRPGVLAIVGAICLPSSEAGAQSLPGPATDRAPGFITRAVAAVSFAGLSSGDPRFTWSARFSGDFDLVTYAKGRVNFVGEYEGVLGSERRELDLNHENYRVEMSASRIVGDTEVAVLLHHVSRHLVDRATERVVAWNTAGIRAIHAVSTGSTTWRGGFEATKMLQHTFVDYAWQSRLVLGVERPMGRRLALVAGGTADLIGIDGRRSDRDSQCGARVHVGLVIDGRRGDVELYAAYERRIDAYPLARTRTRWFEFGFTLSGG